MSQFNLFFPPIIATLIGRSLFSPKTYTSQHLWPEGKREGTKGNKKPLVLTFRPFPKTQYYPWDAQPRSIDTYLFARLLRSRFS